MSTRITEAMVEAMTEVAIDGPGYVSFYPSLHDCRRLLEVALSAEPGEAEGWQPIEAWAVFYDGRLTTLTDRLEVAEAYRRTGILEVRQVAAAPLPEDTHHGR